MFVGVSDARILQQYRRFGIYCFIYHGVQCGSYAMAYTYVPWLSIYYIAVLIHTILVCAVSHMWVCHSHIVRASITCVVG